MSTSAILLIHCPDQRGLVAAVTSFIATNHGNILHLDQHVDSAANVFFMRVEWELAGFTLPREDIVPHFAAVAEEFDMQWELHFTDSTPRMAIFCSTQGHCLHDLLSRWQSGEYRVEIPLVVSNHEALRPIVESFGLPFHVFPMTPETKAAQEQRQLDLLARHNVDFIVLARYMQIVTPRLIEAYPNRIINIHHSFLPAFIGAKPYHAAAARGVKLIGATSHYVTADLDAGPIIAQGVIEVNHRDAVEDMVRKGRDAEKTVLAQAVWHHLHRQILVYNNKTVVFG